MARSFDSGNPDAADVPRTVSNPAADGLKLFGIGLSKTGTTSLATALRLLGYRTIHYPQDPVTARQLMTGDFRLRILEDHDAALDTPIVPFYRDLDRAYPGSKFILTIRRKEDWLRSVESWWQQQPIWWDEETARCYFRAAVYGCIHFHRERFSDVYDTHLENVQQYFRNRSHDLLILDICGGQGWDELCSFLDRPVPEALFPHQNKAIVP